MKKIICLVLVFVMLAAALSGCGKFNFDKEDLSKYVDFGSTTDLTYEMFADRYQQLRIDQSGSYSTFSADWGYTVNFKVTAEVANGDGTYNRYEAWCKDADGNAVENYDIYRNTANAVFDYCLAYDVEDSSEFSKTVREINVGEPFSFTIAVHSDYEDTQVAGKTVRFTVDVTKVLPPIYNDAYIGSMYDSFFEKVGASKETAGIGDTVTLGFTSKVNGEAKDYKWTANGEEYNGSAVDELTFVVGDSGMFEGFDSQLIGHKAKEEFTVTLNLPDDYTDESLRGAEVVYTVKITDITNTDYTIKQNTQFENEWELKSAMRIMLNAKTDIVNVLYERSELKEYPKSLLSQYTKMYEDEVDSNVAAYINDNPDKDYTEDEALEILYPDGSSADYIKNSAEEETYYTLVIYAAKDALGIEFDEDDYNSFLTEMALYYYYVYGESYSAQELEDYLYRDRLVAAYFKKLVCEKLYLEITGMPDIPQAEDEE